MNAIKRDFYIQNKKCENGNLWGLLFDFSELCIFDPVNVLRRYEL